MKDQLNDIKKPLDGILGTVGQTPLIQLHRLFDKLPIEVYAKLEAFNPGGSIKDRTALSILKKAFKTGKLTRKTTIIESSSGNMAIGLAQACLYLGLNLIVVVDPNVNPHTLHILQTYGAKIEKVTKPSTDGGFLGARLDRVKELMASTPNSFWPNQYCNKANPKAHTQTMQEILAQMKGQLDYVLVATSTCGTLMGCADFIRKHGLATKIVAVDAVGSVIFGDSPKKRLIPGHGAGRPSQLLNPEYVDQHIHISDEECVLGCHRLLHREAILAGGSSGALVMALHKIAPQIPAGSRVALILCDRGERYLQTIYSPKWIRRHFGDALLNACKRRNFSAPEDNNPTVEAKRAVAIIGGGPKGLYGMEALTRELRQHPPKYPVEIHIFNRTPHFGAGDVYRPDQPSYWLMNYAAGNIDMWPRNTGEETTDRETFLQWLRKKNVQVDEATVVPRAQVGQYLMDGFLKIINSLPAQVSVKPHVGEVKHIEDHNGGYRVTYTCDEQKTQEVDVTFSNVLLSTGHPRPPVSQYASSQFIPFIYPVENLSRIPAASSVALKGMGLTAIDAILALTEGRGGKFTNNNSNELVYKASGKEPKCIYPYSRSGAPMLPRQHLKNEQLVPLKFLNEKQFAQWQQQEEVDFLQDVWPVLEQEMVYQYYQELLQKTAFHQQLQYSTDTNIYQLVRDFHKHHPQQPVFTAEALLFPFKNSPTAHSQSFHRMVIDHLQHSIAAAQKAAVHSPLMAAASVWRRVAPQFRQLFLQPGLSVNSHQRFDQEYRSALNRIAYGPPLVNAQKLLALAKAKMVNFAFAKNPETNYSIDDQQFQIKSLQQKVTVDYLIDARIPPHSIHKYPPDLYAQMINSGLIRPYKRQDKGGRSYEPGCMDLDVKTGQIIDQNGQKNVFITAMGIPTEGVTFDNDSLSRTCNDYITNWAKQVVQSLQKSK